MAPIWYDGGGFKLYFYSREEHRLPQYVLRKGSAVATPFSTRTHVAVMMGRRRLATVAVESGEILAGSLTAQQHRRIRRLLAEHRAEALAAFESALRQEPVARLDRKPEDGEER
ncbi:hypothetical protein GCM10027062_17150 [Nocardioides hungaricus]